ncbi:MAG: hypothetical protein EBW81_10245, partial [Gammaproteobacteria bacterium]|nr:hypothetical protein [Gammaproteobacteria bacterium]
GNFFIGSNCVDQDDDGTDTDPDDDGWYQSVWDQGVLGQGLLFPVYYDVDNDNDGVPDGEDPDDEADVASHQLELAQNYLDMGMTQTAIELLERVSVSPDQASAEKARALLDVHRS